MLGSQLELFLVRWLLVSQIVYTRLYMEVEVIQGDDGSGRFVSRTGNLVDVDQQLRLHYIPKNTYLRIYNIATTLTQTFHQ